MSGCCSHNHDCDATDCGGSSLYEFVNHPQAREEARPLSCSMRLWMMRAPPSLAAGDGAKRSGRGRSQTNHQALEREATEGRLPSARRRHIVQALHNQ